MDINILGIDIAKNVFQLHGIDKRGAVVVKKQLKTMIFRLSPCGRGRRQRRRVRGVFKEYAYAIKIQKNVALISNRC